MDDNNNRHSAARHPPGGKEANENPTELHNLPIRKRGRSSIEAGTRYRDQNSCVSLRTAALWPLKKASYRAQVSDLGGSVSTQHSKAA